jgi:hypothetical protein
LSNPWQIYLNGEGQPKLTKLEMKRGMTANTKEIQGIIRDCFEYLYSNKLKNIEEMDKFLDTYDHPKLNQEHINHLNRPIKHNKIEAAIKFPKKEHSRT